MKAVIHLFLPGLGLVLFLTTAIHAEERLDLTTDHDKTNYAIGVYLINNIRQQGVDIDLPLVLRGMQDAHRGEKLLLNEEDLSRGIREYQRAVRQKQGPKAKQNAALANKAVGEKFLADNLKKPGVVALPNGLQYKILNDGSGDKPKAGETIEYNYRGTLLNGKEVVSSYKTGKPALFKAQEDAIPGVAEALKLMRPGAKWRLFIPPQLAFGEQGQGGEIGPNITLIYDVELLTAK